MLPPLHYALIRPEHWQAQAALIKRLLKRQDAGPPPDEEEDDDDPEHPQDSPWWTKKDIYGDPLPAPKIQGSTAVIPIKGVLTSGLPRIFRAIGFADTEEIAGWVRSAARDPQVSQLLLAVDSPGGMVMGVPEAAAEVDAASREKPVKAHTKGMMDSGAYWIASQAHEVWCTPSSDVGCVGVYQVHYDLSEMLAEAGIKAEIFKSGDLKAAGHPAIPLTKDQRAHIQAEIETIGAQFRAAVKVKRTMVEDDSLRGQSFLGTEAAARGLVAGNRSFESLL
jgi:signal peptide peptidase SppA